MKTSKSTTTLTAQQIRARSGKILGQNLINHHEEPPDSDYAAHHIIPLADGRTKYAREVRKLFDRFFPPETYLHKPLDEWPINQAFNGVWMRNRNYHLLKKKEIPHSIIHDEAYYKAIYERLRFAESRDDFLMILYLIKEDIIHNRFWDHHPEKLKQIENYRQEKIREYQSLQPYEEELNDIPFDLLADNSDEVTEAMREIEETFKDVLGPYTNAQKEKNPSLIDLSVNNHKATSTQRDPEHTTESYEEIIAELKDVIEQHGSLFPQQTIPHQKLGSLRNRLRNRRRSHLSRPPNRSNHKPNHFAPTNKQSKNDRVNE